MKWCLSTQQICSSVYFTLKEVPEINMERTRRLFVFSQSEESCHLLLDRKDPMDVVKTIIHTVSIHIQRGGTMVNQEDIVECLKPFCANVAVSAAVKTDVLRTIEESFDLSGEDIFLFMFYQTDALVSSNWNQHVSNNFLFLELSIFSFRFSKVFFTGKELYINTE